MKPSAISRASRIALVLSAFALPAAMPAETIRAIAVRGSGDVPVDESFVLSHISAKVGDDLGPSIVGNDVRSLLDTRHFSSVESVAEPFEGGADGDVTLVFNVVPRYRIAGDIELVGNGNDWWWSRSANRKLIELGPGDYVDRALLDAADARILAEYRKQRRYDCRVTSEIIPLEGTLGRAHVRIAIDRGEKYSVPKIAFSGNKAIDGADLRRYSKQRAWWNPAGWFYTKLVDDNDLEMLRDDAQRQYADLGYLNATISQPTVVLTNGEKRISFDVREGAQYRVGAIDIRGAEIFEKDALLRVAGIRPGDVAGRAALKDAGKRLRDHYAARGYIDTDVTVGYVPSETEKDAVDLTFTLKEGSLAYVRDILIRGNARTRDKVIRREIGLYPGDVLNDVQAERGERRLQNLGFFESVTHTAIDTGDGVNYDVLYEVREKPTGQMMLGFGYSSVDHLMGFAEISQNNFDLFNWGRFTGGGQKARIGVEVGGSSSSVEASFLEPWLFDRRLSLSVDAFLRNREYSEFDERRIGASVGVSRHVPWVGRVGLNYTLQHVRLKHIIKGDYCYYDDWYSDRRYRYTDEDDSFMQGSLRLNWTYETLDQRLVPTRGTRASAFFALYGEAFGGGANMFETSLRARHYFQIAPGHVLSVYGRAEAIDSWDGDDIPIGNRYFLGGGRNIRGFRNRAVSPKVGREENERSRANYRPIGGQTLLLGSVEYNISIIPDVMRFGVFYDIGNVWADPFDADFGEFASSAGAGIRLDIPGFPIRMDYAVPLERDDKYSRTTRWVFWVGFD